MDRQCNWIDGAAEPSREGLFELFARDGSARRLGEWPRSGPREVEAALASLGVAAAPTRPSLYELGRLWPCRFEAREADTAARLALSVDELRRLRGGVAFGLGVDARVPTRSVVFSAGRWMTAGEIFERVVGLQLLGASVLLLGAEELPQASDDAREALFELGLAGSGLAVLHGLTPAGWRALGALELGTLAFRGRLDADARASLAGSAEREPGLERALAELGAPRERGFDLATWARSLRLGLDGLSRRAASPRLEQLAETLVQAAFGRVPGLAGLAHGVPLAGRVPARHYAPFVAATLGAMDRLAAREAPLPAFGGAGSRERYRSRWRAALDEGGVLVTGGRDEYSPAGPLLAPTLLVNLPAEARALELGEPLAQLRLARVENPA